MIIFFDKKRRMEAGFSAIEMLAVMFVLILVGGVILVFYKDIFSLNRFLSQGLIAQEEARRALKEMSEEIRVASQASTGSYAVFQVATSTFTFYANLDSDAFKERVRYFLDGNVLKKGITKPSGSPLQYNLAEETISEFAHNVANGLSPVFDYYDSNYNGTTQPLSYPINITDVRLVKINIIIDENIAEPPGAISFTTQVSMRNLKDNL